MYYKIKYHKYKNKYLELKNQIGGAVNRVNFNPDNNSTHEVYSPDDYDRSYKFIVTIQSPINQEFRLYNNTTVLELKKKYVENANKFNRYFTISTNQISLYDNDNNVLADDYDLLGNNTSIVNLKFKN